MDTRTLDPSSTSSRLTHIDAIVVASLPAALSAFQANRDDPARVIAGTTADLVELGPGTSIPADPTPDEYTPSTIDQERWITRTHITAAALCPKINHKIRLQPFLSETTELAHQCCDGPRVK